LCVYHHGSTERAAVAAIELLWQLQTIVDRITMAVRERESSCGTVELTAMSALTTQAALPQPLFSLYRHSRSLSTATAVLSLLSQLFYLYCHNRSLSTATAVLSLDLLP